MTQDHVVSIWIGVGSDGLTTVKVVIEGLAKQGFDREAAKRRFHEIVDRYEDGWDFRLKPHLRPNENDA